MQGNVEGCDIDEMSLEEFLDDKGESGEDYLPEGGYSKIIKGLFLQCKADLKLNHKVISIDYSQPERMTIVTNQGTFHCKYLLCSLPLGVLKQGSVKFIPYLPQKKR